MLTTPLQLAVSTAILANRGRWVTPRMVQFIEQDGARTDPWKDSPPHPAINLKQPEHWERMISAMRDVIHGARGTARGIRTGLQDYDIAGKTGTAQVIGIAQGEKYDEDAIDEWHQKSLSL
jgi:penicillin-binding protein 2